MNDMRLLLNASYKSLEAFEIELPDFTILTGVNGSGKTHILKGIAEKNIQILYNDVDEFLRIKYIDHSELNLRESTLNSNLRGDIHSLWSHYLNNKQLVLKEGFPLFVESREHTIIKKIAEKAEKDIADLEEADFYNYYPLKDSLFITNIFNNTVYTLCVAYYKKLDDNQYRAFRNKEKSENIGYLSDEEFKEKHGEDPLYLINEVLKIANLDYTISSNIRYNRGENFELKLINNLNGIDIKFDDLSSGEKILMSLVLAVYNLKYDLEFPEVLLIDEPDAFLHPSMCKDLLNVLQKVFVEDKKMKVIISSHSPSTIAFAPESAIYVVNKTGIRIEKTSKDKALKVLISGVPAFSVNYENRRQVFVESEYDVAYYEALYKRLSNELNSEVSLNFISSGDSRTDKNGQAVSNCAQVENITNTLRKAGNTFIYGIIDWDKKNKCSEGVKVLGEGKRYSIENYILDPLLVGIILWREKYINNEDLNLSKDKSWRYVDSFDITDLQIIVDFVIDKLCIDKSEAIACKLINDKVINIPKAYLEHQGHNLEGEILKAFPKLNAIKANKEDGLKLAIINKVVDEFTDLLSVDVLDLLKSIQEV